MWERTGTEDAPVWLLEFEHRPGLEVRCTVPSLRARVLAARLAPVLAARLDRDGRGLLALAEVFAEDSLLGWNLAWNGVPREASAAGIARVDEPLIGEILSAWIGLWREPAPPPDPVEPEVDWSQLDALAVDLPDEEDAPELTEVASELAVTGGQ
jgi:hypothetical protein